MSKIRHTKKVTYEMERYPEKCKECPCFSQHPYSCMNEKGLEARCELGDMDGKDMRDFYGNIKYHRCGIETDNRVKLIDVLHSGNIMCFLLCLSMCRNKKRIRSGLLRLILF